MVGLCRAGFAPSLLSSLSASPPTLLLSSRHTHTNSHSFNPHTPQTRPTQTYTRHQLHTYTMLTTDSAPRFSWLHNRMPALLVGEGAVAGWLGSPGYTDEKGALLEVCSGCLHI